MSDSQQKRPVDTTPIIHGPILPEIQILNLFDHLKVLFWVLWKPDIVTRYKLQYGEGALHRVGAWLTTGFFWIPLGFPTLGYFAKRAPLSSTVVTIFMVALPLSAWFVYTRTDLAGSILGVLFYFIHIVDKTAANGDVVVAVAAEVALSIAFLLPLIVSIATTEDYWPMMAMVAIAAGSGTWVALHVGGRGFAWGFSVGLLAFLLVLPLVIELSLILKKRYQKNQRSPVVLSIAALALLAYGVLVWIYMLGGWDILLRS